MLAFLPCLTPHTGSYAANTTTGNVVWSYATGQDVLSSPALLGEVVVVGSHDGHVHGVDAATGRQLWTVPTGSGVHAGPAITPEGMVIVGNMAGTVTALAWPAPAATTRVPAVHPSDEL